ncbi:MAG: ATP-binding protein [Myxococcales bacterium]|jgi:MinD superfamily P-loop ATPase
MKARQLAVLSGKGGTGKTSIVASLAALAGRAVVIDCDVDAANMALLMPGSDGPAQPFYAGRRARILEERCTACGRCMEACRFRALAFKGSRLVVERLACEGCGACAHACPSGAIAYDDNLAGQWWIRPVAEGLLVHARLGIAQDNSGKLVASLRKTGRELAERDGYGLVLVDGPPGIGCPVHAALSGIDALLVVTEPTVAGEHDLRRIVGLAARFGVPTGVVINKHDLVPGAGERIERSCAKLEVPVLGRIPFDPLVPERASRGQPALAASAGTAEALADVWSRAQEQLLSGEPNGSNPHLTGA